MSLYRSPVVPRRDAHWPSLSAPPIPSHLAIWAVVASQPGKVVGAVSVVVLIVVHIAIVARLRKGNLGSFTI